MNFGFYGFPSPPPVVAFRVDQARSITPTSNIGFTNIVNITDGNDTTESTAPVATMPQYIQIDMGMPRFIRSMRALYSDDGHTCSSGSVDYSTDGGTWQTVDSWTGNVAVDQYRIFTGRWARYWRLRVNGVVHGGWGCNIKTVSFFS